MRFTTLIALVAVASAIRVMEDPKIDTTAPAKTEGAKAAMDKLAGALEKAVSKKAPSKEEKKAENKNATGKDEEKKEKVDQCVKGEEGDLCRVE